MIFSARSEPRKLRVGRKKIRSVIRTTGTEFNYRNWILDKPKQMFLSHNNDGSVYLMEGLFYAWPFTRKFT